MLLALITCLGPSWLYLGFFAATMGRIEVFEPLVERNERNQIEMNGERWRLDDPHC